MSSLATAKKPIKMLIRRPPGAAAANFNDLHVLDPSAGPAAWKDLSTRTRGPVPSPRAFHGFVTEGGRIFVFAGQSPGAGAADPSPCRRPTIHIRTALILA
jgi:hypothetical protein